MHNSRTAETNTAPDGLLTDPEPSRLAQRSVRGGVWMIGSQAIRLVLSMGSMMVLSRLLTPQDYGLMGMAVAVTGFLGTYSTMGLGNASVQKEQITERQLAALFWINLSAGIVLTCLTMAIAPAVAYFYGDPRLVWITRALGLGFLFNGLAVQHKALLTRQMRFIALGSVEALSGLGGASVAILLALRGAGYWSLVYGQLSISIVSSLGVWFAGRWCPRLPERGAGIRSMLIFGRNLMGSYTVTYFYRNLDNLLIGRYCGAQQLGFYSRAYQLFLLPIDQLAAPLDGVAVAALSRLVTTPDRYRQMYLRMLGVVAAVTMPGVALMVASADWLIRLLLGSQWGPTVPMFAWLGLTGLTEPIAYTCGWLLISQARTRELVRLGLLIGGIGILSIIGGLRWGAVGVAMCYSVTGLLICKPILFFVVGRTGPVQTSDIYRAAAPAAWATFCVGIALFLLRRTVRIDSPLLGFVSTLTLTLAVGLIALSMTPAGRAVISFAHRGITDWTASRQRLQPDESASQPPFSTVIGSARSDRE